MANFTGKFLCAIHGNFLCSTRPGTRLPLQLEYPGYQSTEVFVRERLLRFYAHIAGVSVIYYTGYRSIQPDNYDKFIIFYLGVSVF